MIILYLHLIKVSLNHPGISNEKPFFKAKEIKTGQEKRINKTT